MRTGRPSKVKWTAEQLEMIRELYPTMGGDLADKMGVDRTCLKNRAHSLGLRFADYHEWTEEQLRVLQERYSIDGPTKLAEEMGIPYNVLMGKVRRMKIGVTRKTPPKEFSWTEDRIMAIKDRYISEGGKALAKEFGVDIDTVRRKASEMGLHTIAGHAEAGKIRAGNNSSCDIHYFDQWSPNMAYILGFLFADGSIHSKNEGVAAVLLAIKDQCVIDFIKSELKSTHKLHYGQSTGFGTNSRYVQLQLSSTILCQQLMHLGMLPRKTYRDDPFPNVPDEMMGHFIRGFLDGDGSICTYGRNQCSVSFVGTPKFIDGLQENLIRLAKMSKRVIQRRQHKNMVLCSVAWTNLDDLPKFKSFVYPEGHGFCLARKKDRLTNWLAQEHRPYKGMRRFSEEEVQYLKKNYRQMTYSEIACRLNRDPGTVKDKVRKLGLFK